MWASFKFCNLEITNYMYLLVWSRLHLCILLLQCHAWHIGCNKYYSQFDIKVKFLGKHSFWLVSIFLSNCLHVTVIKNLFFFLQSKVALLPSESYTVGDLKGEILSLKGLLLNR